MTYFDAIAAGRFKQVEGRWVFYPWAQTAGYLLPRPEEHWSTHAWVVRCLKGWVLAGVAVWLLFGPALVLPVVVGFFTWIRLRSRRVCRGYPMVVVPLTMTESYRARAEVHTWRSLQILAAASFVVMSLGIFAAVAEPAIRASGVLIAVSFGLSLASTSFLLHCKAHG